MQRIRSGFEGLPADVTAVASPCALGRLFDRMVMMMTVNVNVKSEVPFLKACLAQLLLVATDSPRLDDVGAGGFLCMNLREK